MKYSVHEMVYYNILILRSTLEIHIYFVICSVPSQAMQTTFRLTPLFTSQILKDTYDSSSFACDILYFVNDL